MLQGGVTGLETFITAGGFCSYTLRRAQKRSAAHRKHAAALHIRDLHAPSLLRSLGLFHNNNEQVSAVAAAHLKLYGHFPPYWSLNCCSWKQVELSSEHGLCSSLLIFSCSPWKATRFQKTKAEVRLGEKEERCRRAGVQTYSLPCSNYRCNSEAGSSNLTLNDILRTRKIPLQLLFLTGDKSATIHAGWRLPVSSAGCEYVPDEKSSLI